MNTFVSLLRGVNVGGNSRVRMPDLLALYNSLGMENVVTYIQSGNVVFDSPIADPLKIIDLLEDGFGKRFGFSTTILLRDEVDLERVLKNNPFMSPDSDQEHLYVTFLSGKPAHEALERLESLTAEQPAGKGFPDGFRTGEKEIYLYCPAGYGKTKFNNGFFERKMDLAATTRNWRTIQQLLLLVKRRAT